MGWSDGRASSWGGRSVASSAKESGKERAKDKYLRERRHPPTPLWFPFFHRTWKEEEGTLLNSPPPPTTISTPLNCLRRNRPSDTLPPPFVSPDTSYYLPSQFSFPPPPCREYKRKRKRGVIGWQKKEGNENEQLAQEFFPRRGTGGGGGGGGGGGVGVHRAARATTALPFPPSFAHPSFSSVCP